jgi:hypothetical protein
MLKKPRKILISDGMPVLMVLGHSTLRNGLQAYWHLEEPSGNRFDVTGWGSHLSPVNTPGRVAGKYGYSVELQSASSQYLTVNDNDHLHITDNDFTVSAWINVNNFSVMNLLAKIGSSGGDWQLYQLTDRKIYWAVYSTTAKLAEVISTDFGNIATASWYHIVGRYHASLHKILVSVNDVTSMASVTGVVGDSEEPLRIGARNASPLYSMDGKVDEVGFWRRCLDDAEVEWLYNQGNGCYFPFHSAPRSASSLVLCDGNSLTSGVGATPGVDDYPTQLVGLLRLYPAAGSNWRMRNFGAPSQTTTQMSADAARQIDGYTIGALRPKKVCVAWEITNELYAGLSAETAYANFISYCTARRAVGWKVVALTVLPRSNDGTPGDFESKRQAVNSSLRQNWADFADALADVAADARIGDAGDELDTAYYPDRVHLNAAGYAIVAGIVHEAIDGI